MNIGYGICFKILALIVVGVYREWGLQGDKDQKTRDVDAQLLRSQSLVHELRKIRGKSCVLGDFNFCLLDESSRHKHLYCIVL